MIPALTSTPDLARIASYITHVVLMPPALLFVLIALGWLLGRRWPHTGRGISGAALLLLFLLCTPMGADLLVTPLENLTQPLQAATGTGAQAIVVLAAGRIEQADEYAGAHVPDYIALARLRYAAHLQHAAGLPLLVTGGNRAHHAPFVSKAADMAQALREDFRTPVRWVEGNSETTAENASNSRRMLSASGIRRILLVTDAMHMPRAAKVFRASGFDVVEAPTVFLRSKGFDLAEIIPDAEGLRRSYYATYEWVGMLWYMWRPA
jgi:uncharacterized SAM-binding protein YcdF (DUF218 family)